MKNKKVLKKDDIKVSNVPKGINIVIKNEVQQPQEKQKKRRKRRVKKDNLDLLKMSTQASYIPPGNINDIKPVPFKRSSAFTPSQSQLQAQITAPPQAQPLQITAPPPQPLQITAPPPQPLQITAPPPQPLFITYPQWNPMMPIEIGSTTQPIIEEIPDEEIIAALPEDKQEEYENIKMDEAINKKIEKSKITETLNLTEAQTQALKVEASARKQGKQWGTRDSKGLKEPREKYSGNEFYKDNYKKGIERQLKNTKLTADESTELNRLLGLINAF